MIEYIVRVYEDGERTWCINGQLHREDGPALEKADGSKHWYLHGKFHRPNGPAIEDANGFKAWYLHGKRHCPNGPAIEKADGSKAWYLHGKRYQTEADYLAVLKPDKCAGKTIVIDGRTYILTLKED